MAASRQIRQQVEAEREVAGGREVTLSFRSGDEPAVPAILLLPHAPAGAATGGAAATGWAAGAAPGVGTAPGAGAAPGAVLLHGYSSRKEDMAGPVGRALLAEGIASVSIDLPLHGTRSDPLQTQSARSPLGMMQLWREALRDAALAVHYLGARREVDRTRIAIVGYSMGAFLSVVLAADQPSIRAVVLAAGGDLPQGTPFTAVARMVADPLKAVRRLAGRPLLMVNGRQDRTVRPEQAERLFQAAGEPKEIRWWDSGHYLPQQASAGAAVWLRDRLQG